MEDWQIKIIQMDAKLDVIVEKTFIVDNRLSLLDQKFNDLNNFKAKVIGAAGVIVLFALALWDVIKIKLEKIF